MKKFEVEDYALMNTGDILAAFATVNGLPLFALRQGVDFDVMSDEQQEFARETAEKIVAREDMEFFLGRMEEIENLDDLDLPVYVWATIPNRRNYFEPADIRDARVLRDYFEFYKLV